MSKKRPDLNLKLKPKAFARHYWLKKELLAFCREAGLIPKGGKLELSKRIELFLSTGKRQVPKSLSRNLNAKMPASFSRATIITEGFRCSQALRSFLSLRLVLRFILTK